MFFWPLKNSKNVEEIKYKYKRAKLNPKKRNSRRAIELRL